MSGKERDNFKKRKQKEEDEEEEEEGEEENEQDVEKTQEGSSDSEEEDSDNGIVNVDFDYFDIREIDFQATKNLLRQLLDVDSVQFDLSTLADLIIKQNTLGSTIKTDGIDSDPFALLTVLNMNEHKSNPAIRDLADYFILKTAPNPEFNRKLRKLLAPSSTSNIGLIISERLINMPTEVVPPMYKMLSNEIEKAVAHKEPYEFDHFLVLSKSFTEEESKLDQEDSRPSKKRFQNAKEVYYFHPEDELFNKISLHHINYPFTKQVQESDSKRAFQDYGIYPQGQLILLNKESLPDVIKKMEQTFPPF
jgi:protein BCP1